MASLRRARRASASLGDPQLREGDHVRRLLAHGRQQLHHRRRRNGARRRRQCARGVSARPVPFRGREAVYTFFTFGLLFPIAVAALPLYLLLRQLHLDETLLGVALPEAAFGIPITVIILRPFMRAVPAELEDAAAIDGCTSFGFFWRILLPLIRPALITVTILSVITSWNNFILPLLVLADPHHWTLPLGVANYSTDHSRTPPACWPSRRCRSFRPSSSSCSPSAASSAASRARSRASSTKGGGQPPGRSGPNLPLRRVGSRASRCRQRRGSADGDQDAQGLTRLSSTQTTSWIAQDPPCSGKRIAMLVTECGGAGPAPAKGRTSALSDPQRHSAGN